MTETNSQESAWDKIWSQAGFLNTAMNLGRRFYNFFFLSFILRYANQKTEMVELGCGTATLSLLLANKIKKYVGIDFSQKIISLAEQQIKKNNLTNVSIIAGDVLKLKPAVSQSFDLVWSSGLMEHFPSYEAVIKSHWDLARPGGIILISVPYKYSYHFIWYSLTRIRSLRKFWPDEGVDMKFLTRKELYGLGRKFSLGAKVSFLKPAGLGFLLGLIILKMSKPAEF